MLCLIFKMYLLMHTMTSLQYVSGYEGLVPILSNSFNYTYDLTATCQIIWGVLHSEYCGQPVLI